MDTSINMDIIHTLPLLNPIPELLRYRHLPNPLYSTLACPQFLVHASLHRPVWQNVEVTALVIDVEVMSIEGLETMDTWPR
jgi:hypothetical protein